MRAIAVYILRNAQKPAQLFKIIMIIGIYHMTLRDETRTTHKILE